MMTLQDQEEVPSLDDQGDSRGSPAIVSLQDLTPVGTDQSSWFSLTLYCFKSAKLPLLLQIIAYYLVC